MVMFLKQTSAMTTRHHKLKLALLRLLLPLPLLAIVNGLLKETVVDCVEATNQTFVDAIKASGEFTPEAQKAAFEKTLNAVTDILSEDAKEYLTEAFGDLEEYITALIEATVKRVKNGSVA